MATVSGSNSGDLFLGAGKWYSYPWVDGVPQRDKLTMLGDVGSATINTNITSIEHRSSMDKAREVMASVNTEVTQTLNLELFEFNPANVAMGLYGSEGVYEQAEEDITDELHTVSPDTNIRLMNKATNNPYHNVTGVTIKPAVSIPASIGAVVPATSNTGAAVGVATGSYTGTVSGSFWIIITAKNTAPGAVAGAEFTWGFGPRTSMSTNGPVSVTGSPLLLSNGVNIDFTLGATDDFAVGDIYEIPCTAASAAFVEDVDYVCNEVDIREGVINIPPTSGIPEGTDVLVSYKVPKGTYPKVMGGTVGKIERGLLFIGDPNLGPCYNAEFWKVAIKPSGDVNLIGTDFGSFQLECTILSDRQYHPKEPSYSLVKVRSN